jgi:tight adherence protein B
MDNLLIAFSVLVFAAVILVFEAGYLWWSAAHGDEARRIARRLSVMAGVAAPEQRISILKQRHYSQLETLDHFLQQRWLAHALDKLLQQSGLSWSVSQVIGMTLGLMFGTLLVAQALFMPWFVDWGLALAAAMLPSCFLVKSRRARLLRIEAQLPEACDFIARALRAGHSLGNVLQMAGSELPEPLSGELRAVHAEVNYGVPLQDALRSLADRIPLTDLRYMVVAIVIQRESGGNLAEILYNISHIVRERLKLTARVRVLSAEGRMSAWILGLLPFCVGASMSVTSPEYITLLWTDPVGVRLLGYASFMLVLGVLWLRSVIRIRI